MVLKHSTVLEDLPACCASAHILLLALLMVRLDFMIYGSCHVLFLSIATEGWTGQAGMISEVDNGV